jgi:hypothetical protein
LREGWLKNTLSFPFHDPFHFIVDRFKTHFVPHATLTDTPTAVDDEEAAELDARISKTVFLDKTTEFVEQFFLPNDWK